MSPLLFLILYAPFPSASTTSYGLSHFGPSFPFSFAWLALLLLYKKSPGSKVKEERVTLSLVDPVRERPWEGYWRELLLRVSGHQAVNLAICAVSEMSEADGRDFTECVCFFGFASRNLLDGELFEAVDECLSFFQILDHTMFLCYDSLIWLAIKRESTFAAKFFTPICSAIHNPASRDSYSASLLDATNYRIL
ncbi:hypothetical protein Tco_1183348 [Tanacetum coccineum]